MKFYKTMFARKLRELEYCNSELSNYSLIDASAVLRYLLLDSSPLIDVLNREKQLPITYRVNNEKWHEHEEELLLILHWREINPSFSADPADLKKDTFLRFKCLYFMQQLFAVQDIIKFYAYVRGGVHLDKGEEKYQPLREAFQTFSLNGISSLDHSMRGIVQVVLTTLRQNKDGLLS